MFFGAFIGGFLSDRLGRRTTVLFGSVLLAVAGFASAVAPSFSALCVFRAFAGMGIASIAPAFSYFLEFLPPATRGFWEITIQLWY